MAGCQSMNSTTAIRARLRQPDQLERTPEHTSALPACASNRPAGGGRQKRKQQPDRPGRQQDKLAFRKDGRRIFEQEFEHKVD